MQHWDCFYTCNVMARLDAQDFHHALVLISYAIRFAGPFLRLRF